MNEFDSADIYASDGLPDDQCCWLATIKQLDRRMTRMERDLDISVKTLKVFVEFCLSTNPALPEPAAQTARAKTSERYEAFVTALTRRLAKGPNLRQEISEGIGKAATKTIDLLSDAMCVPPR